MNCGAKEPRGAKRSLFFDSNKYKEMENNVTMKAPMRMQVSNSGLENYNYEAYITVFIDDTEEMYEVELHNMDDEWSYFSQKCLTMKEAHSVLLEYVKNQMSEKLRRIVLKGKWAQEHLDCLEGFTL
jgi:hypothetical protein